MATKELIDRLNRQLNREVATILRYMLQAAQIRGAGNESIRNMYLKEVTDEVGHAQYLSNQLVILGGIPKLEPDLAPPPKNVTAMLKQDIKEETVDVQNYRRLAELAEEAGLMALKFKMEEQAAEEDEHGNEMRRLLG